MTPDFDELVGNDLGSEERDRLRRAHELLVAAGPLPELPPSLADPRAPYEEPSRLRSSTAVATRRSRCSQQRSRQRRSASAT